MKKVLLLLALMPFLFTSCGSDDEENKMLEQSLIGVWEETYYWDRTDWHTWGVVHGHVWEFKADKTYNKYESITKYQANSPSSSGTWNISEKFISNEIHAREYSFSSDKQTLTIEHVAIMKKRNDI